jgi:hypothetical protein
MLSSNGRIITLKCINADNGGQAYAYTDSTIISQADLFCKKAGQTNQNVKYTKQSIHIVHSLRLYYLSERRPYYTASTVNE